MTTIQIYFDKSSRKDNKDLIVFLDNNLQKIVTVMKYFIQFKILDKKQTRKALDKYGTLPLMIVDGQPITGTYNIGMFFKVQREQQTRRLLSNNPDDELYTWMESEIAAMKGPDGKIITVDDDTGQDMTNQLMSSFADAQRRRDNMIAETKGGQMERKLLSNTNTNPSADLMRPGQSSYAAPPPTTYSTPPSTQPYGQDRELADVQPTYGRRDPLPHIDQNQDIQASLKAARRSVERNAQDDAMEEAMLGRLGSDF